MNDKIILRIFLLCLVFTQITGVAGALSLAEIGRYDTGYASGVVVSGSYAYVTDVTNGLVVIDISNPAAPTLAGSYDTAGDALNVAVTGSYAYVADYDNGLVIVDISNPAAPTFVGSYDTVGKAQSVAISGSYTYVADHRNGLVVIDISNPAAPTLVGSYDTAGSAVGVAISGSYAYVADLTNALVVIDISNPATPTLAGSYDAGGKASGVTVSGSYAYVADYDDGLVVIDISNPTAPTLVGSYDIAGHATDVVVSSSYAYVADLMNGLAIIDISNPATPTLAGSYDAIGSEAQAVSVSGSYAYIAYYDNGLVIIGESTSGSISVTSSPSGASVYLDGTNKGTTPSTITSVSAGSYTIKLTKTGYTDITKTVNVVSGGTVSVSETLTLIPPSTGSISVSSSPTGASVYLDGISKGTTPYTITSVSVGSHTIKLTKTGYTDITKTVNVVSGGTASVSEILTLIPSSTGSISVSSSPTGASVYLDGTSKGTTPYTITSVPAGSHTIKLTKTGYVDKISKVTVVSGGTASVSETLGLIPPSTGSISVTSSPSGAEVYLDNEYKGTTPLTIESISIGSHALKLVEEGYSDKTKSVTITKDNTETVSMILDPSKEIVAESTNSIDTNAPETDTKESDPAPLPTSTAESSSNSSSIMTYGGIGAILLLLFIGIVAASRNKSKPTNQSMGAHGGKSIKPIKITSAFGYKGAIIQYKVKVENPTSEPIADIKINLYVPDVFLASESTKTITMLKPSESKTVTFEIRPTGECGDCEVSGKVVYYDYSTKKTTGIDIPPKSLSIVCPMLKGKEIGESQWHSIVSNLIETEESTREIDLPAETLFTMTSRIVKDMHMHPLNPEITNSQQLFNGVARFYGEGVKGLKYAAQVEVVGGAKKSRLILKTWAEKEEALTGFYHGLLDEIEKRVHVKGYIDDSIVQNFYHNGDNIGTQVKDSIVQRSTIGTDVSERKCPQCGTVAEGNGKFCNECGGKL